ncbi:hypothetical protein [Phytoactinopolyspora mesophila]|nr:hypothetical protein [Phytoactinopolyspora mesophila]
MGVAASPLSPDDVLVIGLRQIGNLFTRMLELHVQALWAARSA